MKGEGIQRKKRLHKIPLSSQGEVHPFPDISMGKFPTACRNVSKYAKKHLIKFDSAFEIFNVAQNDVAFQLFILTLKEDVSEWFYSLLPETITSWDVLENLFVKIYFSRKYPYYLFLNLVEIRMNKEETVKDLYFIFMKVLHEVPQEVFPNDVIIFKCYENVLPINLRFILRQEGKHTWK